MKTRTFVLAVGLTAFANLAYASGLSCPTGWHSVNAGVHEITGSGFSTAQSALDDCEGDIELNEDTCNSVFNGTQLQEECAVARTGSTWNYVGAYVCCVKDTKRAGY